MISRHENQELRYRVKGQWPFPLDMLRYDESEGASEADKQLIDKLSGEYCPDDINLREVFEITLRRTGSLHWRPTDRRWQSFLWRVSAEPRPAREWARP